MKKVIIATASLLILIAACFFFNFRKDNEKSESVDKIESNQPAPPLSFSGWKERSYLPYVGWRKVYHGAVLRIKFKVADKDRDPFIQLYDGVRNLATYDMVEIRDLKKDKKDRPLPANVIVVGIGEKHNGQDPIEAMSNLIFNHDYEADYNGTRYKFKTPKRKKGVKDYSVLIDVSKTKLIKPKKMTLRFQLNHLAKMSIISYSWYEGKKRRSRSISAKDGENTMEVPVLGGELCLRESATGLVLAYIPKVDDSNIGNLIEETPISIKNKKQVDVSPQEALDLVVDSGLKVLEVRYSPESKVTFSGLSIIKNDIPKVFKLYVGEWSLIWVGKEDQTKSFRIMVSEDGHIHKVEKNK